MARGPKRHLKRLNAPRHWMLDKLGGIWAPRPSTGPHKLRECLPLIILLRNRLKYALTYKEVKYILMQRSIKVDNKARTDSKYPAGFMDVVSIEKTNECAPVPKTFHKPNAAQYEANAFLGPPGCSVQTVAAFTHPGSSACSMMSAAASPCTAFPRRSPSELPPAVPNGSLRAVFFPVVHAVVSACKEPRVIPEVRCGSSLNVTPHLVTCRVDSLPVGPVRIVLVPS